MSTKTLETAWRRQKQWSERANDLKSSLHNWRLTVLGLSIFAAICGTASGVANTEGKYHILTGVLTALSAGIVPVLVKFRLGQEDISKWVRARSASEAFKAEIFQYRTRVGAYTSDDAVDNFSSAIKQISASVEDISSSQAAQPVVEPEKLQELSIEEYIETRVKNQIEKYYRPKANLHAQKANQFRNLHMYLMLFAAVLGAISAFVTVGMGPWIAVVTTVTSSVMAYAAAGRHDELTIGFRATANRLEEIINYWHDKMSGHEPTLQQKSKLVAECEEAISTENQSWHAKFIKE